MNDTDGDLGLSENREKKKEVSRARDLAQWSKLLPGKCWIMMLIPGIKNKQINKQAQTKKESRRGDQPTRFLSKGKAPIKGRQYRMGWRGSMACIAKLHQGRRLALTDFCRKHPKLTLGSCLVWFGEGHGCGPQSRIKEIACQK